MVIPPHVFALLRDGSPDALAVAADWYEENGLDPEAVRHFQRERIVLALACLELNRGRGSWIVLNGTLTPVEAFSVRRESTRENHVVKSLGGEVVGYARPYMPGPTRYFVTVRAHAPLYFLDGIDRFEVHAGSDLIVPLADSLGAPTAICLRVLQDACTQDFEWHTTLRYDITGIEEFRVHAPENGKVEVLSRYAR